MDLQEVVFKNKEALTKIKAALPKLSLRGVKRVLLCALEFPFGTNYPKEGTEEYNVFMQSLVVIETNRMIKDALDKENNNKGETNDKVHESDDYKKE